MNVPKLLNNGFFEDHEIRLQFRDAITQKIYKGIGVWYFKSIR